MISTKMILSCLVVVLVCSTAVFAQAELSRGHSILLEKGFQIQGLCFPHHYITYGEQVSMDRFEESNLTGLNVHGNYLYPAQFDGDISSLQWGWWRSPSNKTTPIISEVLPYLDNLVSAQWLDEQDLTDPVIRQTAIEAMDFMKTNYPTVISHTNQWGDQLSLPELQSFMSDAEPDMIMFDDYAFYGVNGAVKVQQGAGAE